MSNIYPQSLPCRFEGFPARIRVVCGQAFSQARATPYSFGSRATLAQTPKSGQTFGQLAVGTQLPTTEIIYADTGRDDVFDLKISHYGCGRFYLADALPGAPVTPEAVWLQDAEDTNRVRVAWFAGSMPAGGRIVSGHLQLGGDRYLQI